MIRDRGSERQAEAAPEAPDGLGALHGQIVGTIGSSVDQSAEEQAQERLRKSERMLAEAQRLAGLGSWEWDCVKNVVTWSDELYRIYGLTPGEFASSYEAFLERIHPDDRPRVDGLVRGAFESGVFPTFEHRFLRPDGSEGWMQSRGRVTCDETGKPLSMSGTALDITEAHRAEEVLDRRARQQAAIVELGKVALRGLDLPSLLERVVVLVADILDVDFAKVLTLLPGETEFLLEAGFGWDKGLVGRVTVPNSIDSQAGFTLRENRAVVVEDFGKETRFQPPSLLVDHEVMSGISVVVGVEGEAFGVLGAHSRSLRGFHDDDVKFLEAIANLIADTIERQRTEEELREAMRMVEATEVERRRLLTHLLKAEEQERQRIASDIHDDSIQVMTSVAMGLDLLAKDPRTPDLAEVLTRLADTAANSITRLRRLVFNLRPPSLAEEGLLAALCLDLEEQRSASGLEYSIDNQLEEEPEMPLRLVLYRVAHEALINVAKHARATEVRLACALKDDGVELILSDNGIGFDVDWTEGSNPVHIGITEMREKTELAGGRFGISSQVGVGTEVHVWVPV